MKSTFASIALAFMSANLAGAATFNPVTLTQGSYTFNIVVGTNVPPAVPLCVNSFVGSGTAFSDTTFYENGMYARPGKTGYNSGVPIHNTIFTNINNANMTFLMPPSYLTNDDLMIVNSGSYGVITSGTLAFATPTAATSVAVVGTGGNGGCTISYSITHQSGGSETGTVTLPDWFSGGSYNAWGANGRMDQGGGYDNFTGSAVNNNPPFMDAAAVPVTNSSPITSITFNYSSGGGVDNFFAVSAANGGPTYTPVPVTGFNEMAIIPAALPFPVTATMDNGTNVLTGNSPGNTWYSQGYDAQAPGTGLPPSLSTFTSVSQPTHTYQMGDYTTNNATLIDTNHLSANITIAAPAPYTGFAFLTAGGDVGTGNKMTNLAILEHADGVRETNVFYGYDWFESTVPGALAFQANGRIDMNNRTLNNVNNSFPYLFESYFTLNDITSPVTNILVKNQSEPAANSTTYIMAVSATTDPVEPIITQEPLPVTQTWYPSQSATISVAVSGSQPLTNIWLVESNGVYVPLSDGVDANGSTVSGSGTTTLTIDDLALADSTNYEYIATNAVGGEVSTPAAIVVNTGAPVAPIIDSQTPTASFDVLTNHAITTPFSVTVDASSAPPITYQWYSVSSANVTNAIPNATGATYNNVDTNDATLFVVASNLAGTATSAPVTITIVAPAALTPLQAAVFAYHPVAYWPLNETNGTVAFDYAGTNDGVYDGGCQLGNPGLPASGGLGANTSVGFNGTSTYVDIPGAGDLNITGPLTIMQWVQPPPGGDSGFATSLGHSDQSYRLDVVGGQPHFASPGPDVVALNTMNDGNWHFLVGVYDGTNEYLYVDGQPAGTPAAASGTPNSTDDVTIGAAPDYLGARNFSGNIAQVAVLSNALTAAEVQSIYVSLDTAPTATITPANPSIFSGDSITLTEMQTAATPATSLQWYYIDDSGDSNNIPGATGSSYTIVDATASQSGYTYGVIVANSYGTNTASVSLLVQVSQPYVQTGGDLSPLYAEAYAGAPVTYSVTAGGSLPIYYQWSVDGTNVAGATNSSFTAPAECGLHTNQVALSNSYSGGVLSYSSQALLLGTANPTIVSFTNVAGWQLNGSVQNLSGNALELTDGGSGEASSAFYSIAQYAGAFTASFTYTAGGNASADGAVFILQNNAAVSNALGGGGGDLGYYGISNSLGLEINLYTGNGEDLGITAATNGLTFPTGGSQYGSTGSVAVNNGDPINFVLNWAHGVLSVSLTDHVRSVSFSTNYTLGSLAPILNGSDLAYVGFSGSDGGATSAQTISNFVFQSVVPAESLTVSSVKAGSFVLSWPASDSNYMLEQSADLMTWTAGPTPTDVGGVNEVTVTTVGATQTYYRLVRIACQ